jgi:hypothetical protein
MSLRKRWASIRSWFERRGLSPAVSFAYVGTVALFFVVLSQFYIPGKGFSYLIAFGGAQEDIRISKVRKLDYYIQRSSSGYDAQYYVQIAMDPSLQNQALKRAVDSLAYRARRILFSATAFVLGGGDPPAILQVYALQNAFCWLVLAAILLHWFPASSWDNFLRWIGVLFSLGLSLSLRNALIDGPSLLMIAIGLYLADKGRPWWSTGVLALSGLGKETNMLGAASLLPRFDAGRKAWALAILRGLLVAVPLVVWMFYLSLKLGPVMDPGIRNFNWPFVAYVHKWRQVLADLPDVGWPNFGTLWGLFLLISLSVQFLFLVLRPQWQKAWWRVGLSFAVLMVVLGDAVWEGYPGAASRVLLPMQLAFNVLVPLGRGWRVVLIAGNLTLFASFFELQPPSIEGYVLGGNSSLFSTAAGKAMSLQYTNGWYGSEGTRSFFWCWTKGNAGQKIENPHAFPVKARLKFSLFVAGRRSVQLKLNGEEVWESTLGENQLITASLSALRLKPGTNVLEWQTDAPPVLVASDPRELAFVVQNLHLDVLHEFTSDNDP